ncbi:hypothetical protein [Rubritalea tangerina]
MVGVYMVKLARSTLTRRSERDLSGGLESALSGDLVGVRNQKCLL